MDKKIVATAPADKWFFYHSDHVDGSKELIFHRVAVWASYDTGETIGLVGVNLKASEGQRLVAPPPIDGGYIHWDEMTNEQQKKAISGSQVSARSTAIGGIA